MRQMKDSGIEWIGEIPENWKTIKNKYLFSLRSGESISKEDLVDEGAYPVYGGGERIGFYDRYNVSDRTILIGRVGARCGCITLIDSLCWATDNALIAEFPKLNDYYVYALIAANLNSLNDSNAQPLITATKILNVTIPNPNNDEQQAISAHLDSQCTHIDNIIEKTKASIEEYKKLRQAVITQAVTKGVRGDRPMKDSGIEWIGEIPEEWKIQRGKNIMKKLDRPVLEGDGVITCFRDGEVTLRSNRREDGFTVSLQETGYQGIEPGDLVVHGMDGFAGSIGISDSRGKATPVLNVLDSNENKKYLMYFMRAAAYCGLFLSLATGIRIRTCDTNWNKLKDILYIIPSKQEQEEIARYIEIECSKIDSLISKKEQFLTELESYKKSMIYEYVTGKKEVPQS